MTQGYKKKKFSLKYFFSKQANLHETTVTWNNNQLMLYKQLTNEEKAWYGFHIETGKGSMVGEHWMYNKF